MPGLAKTQLVETLGTILGLDAKRIQFTPDLMPSDIIGSEVLEDSAGGRRSFRFVRGPIFAQLLMADEINRASPRTQSALLQAMQEHHVTVAGQRHDAARARSTCWRRRTRWSRRAPIRCPKPSSTASCCRSTSTIPIRAPSGACCSPPPAPTERRVEAILSAQELQAIQRLVRQLPVPDKVVGGDPAARALGAAVVPAPAPTPTG